MVGHQRLPLLGLFIITLYSENTQWRSGATPHHTLVELWAQNPGQDLVDTSSVSHLNHTEQVSLHVDWLRVAPPTKRVVSHVCPIYAVSMQFKPSKNAGNVFNH